MTLRVDPRLSDGVGGAASYGVWRRISQEDHRVPRSDDGSREVPSTMPPVRHAHSTYRVRGSRDQLLPELPDRRQTPQGSGALKAPPRGLASYARRTRRELRSSAESLTERAPSLPPSSPPLPPLLPFRCASIRSRLSSDPVRFAGSGRAPALPFGWLSCRRPLFRVFHSSG